MAGAKLATSPASTARRSTRCAASSVSASKSAYPPSNSSTSMPGSSRSQPASPVETSSNLRCACCARRPSRVPEARIVPPAMMTRSSHRRSTTSSWCEENSTAVPSAARACSTAATTSTASGSSPENGSSRMSTFGSWTSAAAICARCWLPSDSVSMLSFSRSPRPRSWRSTVARDVASALENPWSRARYTMCSSTRIFGYRPRSSGM